jgi:hypothetical protein
MVGFESFLIDVTHASFIHGKLLTTIDGGGARDCRQPDRRVGQRSRFRDAAALASYGGVVQRLWQSGKRAFSGARGLPLGMRACVIVASPYAVAAS